MMAISAPLGFAMLSPAAGRAKISSMQEAQLPGTVLPARLCVYCCERKATTRDHVPPKALGRFNGARITVPSCPACNNGQSKEDEYLRAMLAPNVAAQNPAARPAWETAFRGMQRPEAAGFKRTFFESLEYAELVAANQERQRVLTYDITAARLGRVAARMIRGLYYHETGRCLPDHHVLSWPFDFLQQREVKPKELCTFALQVATHLESRRRHRIGEGVLTYAWERFEEFLAWWLVFYDGLPFLGLAIPRRPNEPLPSWHADFQFPQS